VVIGFPKTERACAIQRKFLIVSLKFNQIFLFYTNFNVLVSNFSLIVCVTQQTFSATADSSEIRINYVTDFKFVLSNESN